MKYLLLILFAGMGGLFFHMSSYPDSATVQNQILIQKPVEEVFEYVTTPGNWPEWHPSSREVSGTTDHSLDIGEQVREAFKVAGREGEVVWTVTDKQVPVKWVIEGEIVNGKGTGGTISYVLTSQNGATLFERTFEYRLIKYWHYLLNELFAERKVRRESRQAVEALKTALEHP